MEKFTEPLPIGTKVRILEPKKRIWGEEAFHDQVGKVFEVIDHTNKVDGQTHKINWYGLSAYGWWVFDTDLEVVNDKEEK